MTKRSYVLYQVTFPGVGNNQAPMVHDEQAKREWGGVVDVASNRNGGNVRHL